MRRWIDRVRIPSCLLFIPSSAMPGEGGAVRVSGVGSEIELSRNRFEENHGRQGGAFRADTAPAVSVRQNLFRANSAAEDGAAISIVAPARGWVRSNTIVDSEVDAGSAGAAVQFVGEVGVHFERNIVAWTKGGYGWSAGSADSVTVRSHNLFWENELGPYARGGRTDFELFVEPGFRTLDPDYGLRPASLAIDSGGESTAGSRLDLGWQSFVYPEDPKVEIAFLDLPDRVAAGSEVSGQVEIVNRRDGTLRVAWRVTAVAGPVVIDSEVQAVDVGPRGTRRIPIHYQVPLEGTRREDFVLLVRAWVGERVEAGDGAEIRVDWP